MHIHYVYIYYYSHFKGFLMGILDVGKRLQKLRKSTPLKQADVAFALEDRSTSTVSHWETGTREMNFSDVVQYHEVLKEYIGDNWLYVVTERRLANESDSAYVLKADIISSLAAFLEECNALKTIRFKGDSKEIASQFVAKYLSVDSGQHVKKAES